MIVPMEDDPRNELYKMYVQFLKKYKPRMFVFENVADKDRKRWTSI